MWRIVCGTHACEVVMPPGFWGGNMLINNLVDIKVRDLENTIELLNSLVESYKMEMALMKFERDYFRDSCAEALNLVGSFQYAQAQVLLREVVNPVVIKNDPVQTEIESLT